MQMRKDYEKKQQEINKIKLDVVGEQFILDSQINTISNQTSTLYDNKDEYEIQIKKDIFDTD